MVVVETVPFTALWAWPVLNNADGSFLENVHLKVSLPEVTPQGLRGGAGRGLLLAEFWASS